MKEALYVCPPWIGRILASPLRKFYQDPDRILTPYLNRGMTAMDVGCAMGFFSLPLARLVGPEGRVVCVDLQETMLEQLKKRARRTGLLPRLICIKADSDSLALASWEERIDIALAFAVMHEIPEQGEALREISAALKKGGRLLLAEPKGHVTLNYFSRTMGLARRQNLILEGNPDIRGSHTALLRKE